MIKAFIFDLDGVIVDTAVLHYEAWSKLAGSLGFEFTLEDNERLKGVSRMQSLEIVLDIGHVHATLAEKEAMAKQKNDWYLELVNKMTPDDILPGAKEFVMEVRNKGYKTAIGSASKNTYTILDKVGIASLFDVVIDGNKVVNTKPDPEVFLLAAGELNVLPDECVVFEDAAAGIEAAKRAGMKSIGIGKKEILSLADKVIPSLAYAKLSDFE